MRRRTMAVGGAVLGIAWACWTTTAAAQPGPTPLTLERVAQIGNAVFATAAPGDLERVFIVQQDGHIRLLDRRTGTLQAEAFLRVTPLQMGAETGLLGLAFHPNFAENGYFWVYHNTSSGAVVARYRAAGNPLTATAADPTSREVVLHIAWLNAFHVGGWIGFAPDGHLLVSVGDGGTSTAPQDITDELRGKLLRIDVDGPDDIPGNADDDGFPTDANRLYTAPADNPFVGVEGDDEIWAYGLRNPWRCDIDPSTGDIFIADVGALSWEEVNFQPASEPGAGPGDPGYMGGRNYGWWCYEGNSLHGCTGLTGTTFPILVYGHSQSVPPTNASGCSITGGVIYRGCGVPDLDGTYFFGDYCSQRIFSLRYDGVEIGDFRERTAELGSLGIGNLRGFGRDAWGEAYICANSGVFRIVPAGRYDINGDRIPDACRCPADWNADGAFNSADLSRFLEVWLESVIQGTQAADYDRNSVTNSADISAFLASWLAALEGGC